MTIIKNRIKVVYILILLQIKCIKPNLCIYFYNKYYQKIGFLQNLSFDNKETIKDKFFIFYTDEEMRSKIDYIKESASQSIIKKQPMNGVLLHGKPGNGKTLLALKIAKELELPMITTNENNYLSHRNQFLENMKNLFKYVKSNSPCVFFIDDLDLLISNKEKEKLTDKENQCLSAFLNYLDNPQATHNVLTIAATSYPERIDSALLRPNRLGYSVEVKPPKKDLISKLFFHKANSEVSRYIEDSKKITYHLHRNIFPKMEEEEFSIADVLNFGDKVVALIKNINKDRNKYIPSEDIKDIHNPDSILESINKDISNTEDYIIEKINLLKNSIK